MLNVCVDVNGMVAALLNALTLGMGTKKGAAAVFCICRGDHASCATCCAAPSNWSSQKQGSWLQVSLSRIWCHAQRPILAVGAVTATAVQLVSACAQRSLDADLTMTRCCRVCVRFQTCLILCWVAGLGAMVWDLCSTADVLADGLSAEHT